MLLEVFQVDHPHIINDYIPTNTMSDTALIKKKIFEMTGQIIVLICRKYVIETHKVLDKNIIKTNIFFIFNDYDNNIIGYNLK